VTIEVGDLVVVVKPTECGCDHSVGLVYRVARVDLSVPGGVACMHCGTPWSRRLLAFHDGGAGAEPYRLKRIPPLSELESEKNKEELHA